MTRSTLYRGFAALLLLACASGCGKKGDLYRPDAKAQPAEQPESGKAPTADPPPATPTTQP